MGFAADGVIGLTGWLTVHARRMACRAGLHESFRKAEGLLLELSGWSINAETLRRHVHAEAAGATQTRSMRVGLPEAFVKASGDGELHIDAGKVNTQAGWRDVKVAVFAVRKRGSSATSVDYEQRELPTPSVRSVIAAVEEVGDFELRCRAEANRLKLTPTQLSVLGDGAEWIWNLVGRQFVGASEVLDVYHAVEHLATAGRVALGDGPALNHWLQTSRRLLVSDGYCGACEALCRPLLDPEATDRFRAAVGSELNYFAGHRTRMGYAVRLRRGQAIGSGLVEGTIKQRVNLRLKRTGARWRPERVGPFVELLALSDTVEWMEHWKTLAA